MNNDMANNSIVSDTSSSLSSDCEGSNAEPAKI